MKRCVIHREDCPNVVELLALCPLAFALPRLQRNAHGDHTEIGLFGVCQDDVLVGPLGLLSADIGPDLFINQ